MKTKSDFIYWIIPGALAGMPMPFVHPERRLNLGGSLEEFEDELVELHAAGIRGIVTLLNIPSNETIFNQAGFSFLCLSIPDGRAPTIEQVNSFVQFVDEHRAARTAVAVHCEAGLGRTGTMLAAYLIAKGDKPDIAIASIRSIEPAAIETGEQVKFLYGLSDILVDTKR
ncbi:MAG: dual specificity protein phosphatase family protein [Verrucomicrobia bacterium]|nr:dual specificity protein phosphatase family protein [Verrucomicrobiota bacterium]